MLAEAPFYGYNNIKIVESFEELRTTAFNGEVNALCWQRSLDGDFGEIVRATGEVDEICAIGDDYLYDLDLSDAGAAAREILINDQKLLRDANLDPILDIIPAYPIDDAPGPVSTDVYSFHADSATVLADTYLCSYNAPSSEGIRNKEAIRKVDIPEIRAELLRLYGGADDEDFIKYLSENCYDLHYAAKPEAQPFTFGIGNLWRIATQCPGSPVLPCIHRAPTTLSGHSPRLLLIS